MALLDPADSARPDLDAARARLEEAGLERHDLAPDPIDTLRSWRALAHDLRLPEPDAMALATATPDGRPSVRFVLLRQIDDGALWFFTNYDSRKGREIAGNPRAAAVLSWYPIGRQVRVEGPVRVADPARSDDYFDARPVGSRLSAVVSPQSRAIPDRATLLAARAAAAARLGGDVPRPANWGGYGIVPEVVEFWQGRRDRLHDRFVYRRPVGRPEAGSPWQVDRLAP